MSLNVSVEDRLREIRARYSRVEGRPRPKALAQNPLNVGMNRVEVRSTTRSQIEKENFSREGPPVAKGSEQRQHEHKLE
jgi:hypothetical protein